MVAERLFGWSSHPRFSPYSQLGLMTLPVPVLQWRMHALAVESSGLNWMIKLSCTRIRVVFLGSPAV